MKSDPDAAKLDELKRLLQRLDKAFPQSRADAAQAPGVRSRPAQAGQRPDATSRRTIVLAIGVSMIVSLSVAVLLFHDTPVRRFIASQAPPKEDVGPAPVPGDGSPTGDQPSALIRGTAVPQADEAPRLQREPQTARDEPSEVAAGHALPPYTAPTAAVAARDTPPPPMETGGVAEAARSAPEVLDAGVRSADRLPAAASVVSPDTDKQSDANRVALVELDAVQFMRRGLLILSRGNVSAAQLLLERAADLGSGEAAFALASTYDGAPGAPRHGREVQPNTGLALRWYARAEELGVEEARKRLAALKSGDDASAR